jgi:TolA-binding protein
MYKNDGIGKVSYSDRELAKLTGLDRSVISKNNNSLMSKNLMTQVTLQSRDSETGLMNKETIYHLNELGQAIVFAITNHEERIQQNTQDIETLKSQIKDNQILLAEIKRLQEENKALKGLDIPRQFEF